jgi:catechol 2,3-dioxygenase-like lactoylglutathione lyase family enzyme
MPARSHGRKEKQHVANSVAFEQVLAVLPASDLGRARQFYSEKLGLTPIEEQAAGLYFQVSPGHGFLVYEAGSPANGQHTQAGFLVPNLDAAMSDLRNRGVTFEEYDIPGVHTEKAVVTFPNGRGAFFKDSEGNILGLNELNVEARSAMGI